MGASPQATQIASALLTWFAQAQRPLPWRKTYDPYQVWISEIMLQQTRVETVLPYFSRWLEAFPTVQALAAAPPERVLKLWEGLGYYSRARNLHRAAQEIAVFGGVPQEYAALLKLPGIGPYTAAAIASIAFDQTYPVLDGNVERVFARLLDWPEPIKTKSTLSRFQDFGQSIVELGSPRLLNQALMELGALVCLPQTPACPQCPLQSLCLAHAQGTQSQRPVARPRPETIREQRHFLVLEWQGKYLVRQQAKGRRWAGLYQFPNWLAQQTPAELALAQWGLTGEWQALGGFRYSITKYQVQAQAWHCLASEPPEVQGEWLSLEELERATLARPAVKIRQQLALLQNHPPRLPRRRSAAK